MKILICGASGFIGRHLAQVLQDGGHQVWHGGRNNDLPRTPFSVAIDYRQPLNAASVQGMDVVINAVGILNGSDADFVQMHTDAPIALFDACQQAEVKRFVQISALAGGAHAVAQASAPALADLPAFLASKHAADSYMQTHAHAMHCLIVRPSLVVGVDGASSQMFRSLASLPLLLLPGSGAQQVQPVHIIDLCHAIKNWIEQAQTGSRMVAAVGPHAISYRAMLARYRSDMGLPAAPAIPLPMPLVRAACQLASALPIKLPGMAGAALSPANLRMLEANNTAAPDAFAQLLGRTPRERWLGALPASHSRQAAIAAWATPLLKLSLALLWWITALVSSGLYPLADSLALLAPLRLPHGVALLLLYGAAGLDLTLGLATLWWPSRRLWWLQIGLILGYTLIISLTLPHFWLHPFGPILKNLPILALLFVLLAQETRP
jgi:nucleoside-diphosphate-sugar epimerase